MVGQGRYPVLIGTADFAVIARARQGVPVKIIDPRQLKEGSDVSSSNGNLAVFNRAPHPNAAKIYANWYLSKEGQTSFARASGYVSSRLDVSHRSRRALDGSDTGGDQELWHRGPGNKAEGGSIGQRRLSLAD